MNRHPAPTERTGPGFLDPQSRAVNLDRIHAKFRPAWESLASNRHRLALALYFFPHRSRQDTLTPTRPRVVKWYCPFACQKTFPSGHRYCINVYAGCAHDCQYCYAYSYGPAQAAPKTDFARGLARDMEDLDQFDVPPAPVHLSNSTDPFQPLESRHGHTRLALEQILRHRRRFTSVVLLTKNPLLPVQAGYLDLFKELLRLPEEHPQHTLFAAEGRPAFLVEVSLAFWREEARAAYDCAAPPLADRMEGIRALRAAGIPVVLRIDPLFPRSPLPGGKSLADFGLVEAQTLDELQQLVRFATDIQARHVVYSHAKIVQPRTRKLSPTMQAWRRVYEHLAAPARLDFHGGAWRLPREVAEPNVVGALRNLCRTAGVPAKFCMQNLLETP